MSKEYLFTKIRAMGSWLRANGLDGINNQERYRALLCLENLQAIERWRDGLDEMQRRRLNHPGAIWAHWQRSLKAEASRQRQHVVATVTAKTAKRGSNIAIRWPGTMLKRAAAAIREARSNDTIVLAKVALSAAIRTRSICLNCCRTRRRPSRRRAHRSARQLHSKFTHRTTP
jgi:hypothetical protein